MIRDLLISAAAGDSWLDVVNYEIIKGNALWRFGGVLVVILTTLIVGRVLQYAINSYAARLERKTGMNVLVLIFRGLSKPAYVAVFAGGFFFCKALLYFNDDSGISTSVGATWTKIAKVLGAVAVAYALYRFVDVAEHFLHKVVGRTETKLDDMLVPVIRKSLRITITIVAVLLIAENILDQNVKSLLLSAGVGGIAIALAAKDTIANFFGSITIFADRPFQIQDLVKIEGHYGSIEEVGFRSSRIRTLEGHLVTIPNNTIANANIENVGKRPYIRRTSNITITYDSGTKKTQRAVEIIKSVLADVAEVNADPERPPRVYFSDFNDWSLNIYMSYWVKPADYWLYQGVNERVNFEIMKRFEAEGIEFAFPSQTLYLKKDSNA
ncbi:MAG TPA: mechanosensitive ion channel family protein [Planctomycetes bacterium]|nr:mechanosensitive ion channel family protein [Planctomycetota bacterium]